MNNEKTESASPHVLPSLPYDDNALAPIISANTIGFHYDKHHRGYVDNLNKLTAGGEYADMPLEKIIAETSGNADMPKAAGVKPLLTIDVWEHSYQNRRTDYLSAILDRLINWGFVAENLA